MSECLIGRRLWDGRGRSGPRTAFATHTVSGSLRHGAYWGICLMLCSTHMRAMGGGNTAFHQRARRVG
jgi:hypothetical protein